MTKFASGDIEKKARYADDGVDHRKVCCYEVYGEKCQRLGPMSHGTKGDGPWFCIDHFFGRDVKQKPAIQDWCDAAIDALIKPEDYRQPNESRTAYRQRMMSEIRANLVRFGQRLPYDKNAQLEPDEERRAIQEESL